VGTNPAECHPIIFNRLHKYLKRNQQAKLIVVNPAEPKPPAANLHLAINPGTDIDLFNGIAHLLLDWGAIDTYFIDKCTRDFRKYAEIIRHYPPKSLRINAVSPSTIQKRLPATGRIEKSAFPLVDGYQSIQRRHGQSPHFNQFTPNDG
jgi:anaerobic selenocysteine-containing dehydrogenase